MVGLTVEWPHVAMLASGNEGVASRIRIAQGAIGCVEYGFALRLGLPMASLENKDGQFVAPSPLSGAAALVPISNVDLDWLDRATAAPTGAKAYPIVTYELASLSQDIPEGTGGRRRFVPGFRFGRRTKLRAILWLSAASRLRSSNARRAAVAQFRSANELAAAPASRGYGDPMSLRRRLQLRRGRRALKRVLLPPKRRQAPTPSGAIRPCRVSRSSSTATPRVGVILRPQTGAWTFAVCTLAR